MNRVLPRSSRPPPLKYHVRSAKAAPRLTLTSPSSAPAGAACTRSATIGTPLRERTSVAWPESGGTRSSSA